VTGPVRSVPVRAFSKKRITASLQTVWAEKQVDIS
jgi:hypothetical protein